jgi:hypothetical protein
MVLIDSDSPTIWWKFDDFGYLKAARKEWGFGEAVWREEAIPDFAIRDSEIAFDVPQTGNWADNEPVVVLRKNTDGFYRCTGKNWTYEAVRADTPRNVLLTGRFSDEAGKGVFIISLPKRTP